MRTLAKILLLVFWLLGAGSGITVSESTPADPPAYYRYAVAEGVDVAVQGHRVTVRVEHRAVPRAVALTVAVPSWVAAWSHRPKRALTASSDAVPSDPAPSDATPHNDNS